MAKMPLYYPLAHVTRTPRNPTDGPNVKAFSVAPMSPRSNNMMRKSRILIQGKQIPVWVDMQTNIVFPYMKD